MTTNLRSISNGYKHGAKKKPTSRQLQHATRYSFCAATPGEIADTREYSDFMNKNLNWQKLNSKPHLVAKFKSEGFKGELFDNVCAQLACRLMLRAMDGGATIDWHKEAPRYVLRAISQDMVADMAIAKANDKNRMTWAPSGPQNDNDFTKYIMGTDQNKHQDMALMPKTLLNCWEFVTAMGINSDRYNWGKLKEGYVQRIDDYDKLFNALKGGPEYTCYDSRGFWDILPLKGDMVFFDGLSHVALATGYEDEVISFWILPEANAKPSKVSSGGQASVVRVTLKKILDACKQNQIPVSKVTFTTAPWNLAWPD